MNHPAALRMLACLALGFTLTSRAVQAADYVDQTFSSGIGGGWYSPSGSISTSANGLTSAGTGAIISQAVPSGPNQGTAGPYEYEIRTTMRIQVAGGSYVTYFRATADAFLNPSGASQGSFYAFEVKPDAVSPGYCHAMVNLYKHSPGSGLTLLGAGSLMCSTNFVVRTVVRNHVMYIFKDDWDGCCFYADPALLTTGQPGFGVSGVPSGNGILRGELVYADTVSPTTPPRPGVTAFADKVEMQWTGTGDDPNGSGLLVYQLLRRDYPSGAWEFKANLRKPNFIDTAVQPGTQYEYLLTSFDYHHNSALDPPVFRVQTAPAGSTDPARRGVRPDGSYWGGSGEQIDIGSGNLNFNLPLITAQARGGWSVPFSLNYDSQIWRKDPAGIWKLARDSGYGHGWKLMIGSVTPVYRDWWDLSHYVYRALVERSIAWT